MQIKTPHIIAEEGDFAKIVLMPGDPLRAKYIAETYLENAREIQSVRGILAYTGEYKGKVISIMASGMGMPSMGIYSYELYKFFGVERIIRIGTAGSINENLKLRDIVIAMGACTDSNYISQYDLKGNYAPIADYDLLKTAVDTTKELGHNAVVGNVLTSDIFYNECNEEFGKWAKLGVLATEMETAALYINAARLGKKALTICTITDEILTGNKCSVEERQLALNEMIEVALNTAIQFA